MTAKYGVNTDEADKESYEAAEEYTAQRIAEEWSEYRTTQEIRESENGNAKELA